MADDQTEGENPEVPEPADAPPAPAEQSGDYVPDEFEHSAEQPGDGADINLSLVLEVPVDVALHVGKTAISIRELMNLVEGSVVELDRAATDPMDVLVNGTLVAKGEIVVVNENFGVRLTDVVSPADRIRELN